MKKILIVFGTRPEAIKMAPLVKAFQHEKLFDVKVAVTAQHREMLDQVLRLFDIKPDYDLDLMKASQDLVDITTGVLLGLREVFKKFLPDLVLVHGDTATSFAASLVAFYHHIPVGHVEAGLRTGNILSPWPEEANRLLTGRLAKLHFAPTIRNKEALLDEGVCESQIALTGNTVIDALQWVVDKIRTSPDLKVSIEKSLADAQLNSNIFTKRYVLVTGHRRENFGLGFEKICQALRGLALSNKDVDFVYPVHLNPNVQEPVSRLLGNVSNVHLIKPLGYEAFVYLMLHSYFVLTDSGGVQEEAPGLCKPVLVMRNTTERPEAVEAGTVKLVGTDANAITAEVQRLLNDDAAYKRMSLAHNPYGDGTASQRIVQFIKGLNNNDT